LLARKLGKTHLLVALAEEIPHTKAIYMAYNKSIATEASRKFPNSVTCKTTHSLAYGNTVKPLKLKLGNFSYRSINEKISYDLKCEVVDNIKEFCLSKYLDFDDYSDHKELTPLIHKVVEKYLANMHAGTTECTHDFYLKLFHILLVSGDIEFEEFDILFLDESGDLNEVTLEIFLNLPAKKRIAVGDKYQNIYTFNHTINAFEILDGKGTEFQLSRSFRVSSPIASRIQRFGQTYLNPDMKFTGIDYEDYAVKSRGFISRTNAALIDKMIELNKTNTPYGLVRKASDIFKNSLMICGLSYQGTIYDPAYKHLQADVDDWYEKPEIKHAHRSFVAYLSDLYSNDITLVGAIRLVGKHGKPLIMDTYKHAKSHEAYKCNFTLATTHSVKGLEFDEVIVSDDMNSSIQDTVEMLNEFPKARLTSQETESMNLYYVAASRARKSLLNAAYL
jgi:F-box protein 18 (helicase)